ncbi:MAG: NUDIX hydrolase, partial [Congregibacter sp.]|nr:NUDIX hydrolase [Congregibacter sp.]
GEGKRFSTWIFAGEVDRDAQVVIDGSEIHDFQWIGVQQALNLHKQGELPLMPPTFITLCAVGRYSTAAEALAGELETPCPRVLPLMVPIEGEGGYTTLYPGDAAYETGDIHAEGPRHRAFLSDACWQYQYEGVSEPPLYPQD